MGSTEALECEGDRGTWTLRNEGPEEIVVVFEPYGDEIRLRPGSTWVIRVHAGRRPRDGEAPLTVLPREGQRVTVWAQWPGVHGGAYLDGEEV